MIIIIIMQHDGKRRIILVIYVPDMIYASSHLFLQLFGEVDIYHILLERKVIG